MMTHKTDRDFSAEFDHIGNLNFGDNDEFELSFGLWQGRVEIDAPRRWDFEAECYEPVGWSEFPQPYDELLRTARETLHMMEQEAADPNV